MHKGRARLMWLPTRLLDLVFLVSYVPLAAYIAQKTRALSPLRAGSVEYSPRIAADAATQSSRAAGAMKTAMLLLLLASTDALRVARLRMARAPAQLRMARAPAPRLIARTLLRSEPEEATPEVDTTAVEWTKVERDVLGPGQPAWQWGHILA